MKPHVHIPFDSYDKYLAFFKKEKLDLEIYFGSRSFDGLEKSDLIRLKSKLDYNPRISIHGPFMDLSPGAVDLNVREITIKRFLETLEVAEVLKPEAIVFHSGYDKWKYDNRVDIWLEGSLYTWKRVNERASDLGINIALENIFEDEPDHLRLLSEEMNAENFGICFDTGHFNLFSRMSVKEWLDIIRPHVKEFHIHDNAGFEDEHLPIGDGTFDFDTFFREVKGLNCVYTLEAHNVKNARKSLKRFDGYINR